MTHWEYIGEGFSSQSIESATQVAIQSSLFGSTAAPPCIALSQNRTLAGAAVLCRSPANHGIIGAKSWPGDAANIPGRGATCGNR